MQIINWSFRWFLYDAYLRCPKDAIPNLPPALHDGADMVVFIFWFRYREYSFVYIRVKLLTLRVKLYNTESLEAGIHHMRCHCHSLWDFYEMLLQLFNFLRFSNVDFLYVFGGHLDVVSNIDKVLRELSDSEFSGLVDLLFVSLDRVVILCQLVYQLILVLLHLLLQSFDLYVLVRDEGLNLFEVCFWERLLFLIAWTCTLFFSLLLFFFLLILFGVFRFGCGEQHSLLCDKWGLSYCTLRLTIELSEVAHVRSFNQEAKYLDVCFHHCIFNLWS